MSVLVRIEGDLLVRTGVELPETPALQGACYRDALGQRHYRFAITRSSSCGDRRRMVMALNRWFKATLGYVPHAIDGWWKCEVRQEEISWPQ